MRISDWSSDVCSSDLGEDRAAMACHLVLDASGKVKSWRFSRAVIRVAAVLAYEDAQAAIDGTLDIAADDTPARPPTPSRLRAGELLETALKPLWACWTLLRKARDKREPLALDLPERRVVLDDYGKIVSVAVRARLDAHMLIEDYLIAANRSEEH